MKVVSLHKNYKSLISRASKGNQKAQHELFELFASKMLSVCRQYMKNNVLAEEVMLTGFLKVFTNLNSFKSQGSFEGWIRRIMINECISFIRVQKKVKFIEDETYFEESYNNIESQFSVEDIQSVIDFLPDGYKMVFNLFAIEGFKHQEIAEMLGINEGTSKSQLSHARKMLQDNINKLKNYSNGTV